MLYVTVSLLATYVGVLASLPVASEVSGVSSRASAEGAVPKGVVEDREKRVSAAVCVANPPLPVEARGMSGFRLRLAPRAHLHPVVAGDDASCGFEQGEHIVRVAPKLPKIVSLGGAVGSEKTAVGTDVRGPHLGAVLARRMSFVTGSLSYRGQPLNLEFTMMACESYSLLTLSARAPTGLPSPQTRARV